MRTQVPSAAVVYTPDCSVGRGSSKNSSWTQVLSLHRHHDSSHSTWIKWESAPNCHRFSLLGFQWFAPLFQALESNKGQSNIAGFLKIESSHVKSMSTGVLDISFQGRFTRCTFLIPFCTSMIIYEWFMNMCALCLFSKNPEGNPNQRCFVHPCHFAWSCVSLMSPTLAFQMSLN